MRFSRIFSIAVVCAAITLAAAPVLAQQPSSASAPPAAEPSTPGGPGPDLEPLNFGTQDGIDYWVGGYAFTPRQSSLPCEYDGNTGAVYFNTGSTSMAEAQVNLPQGAYVDGMRIYYYDNDPTYSLRVWFTRYEGSTPPTYNDLASYTTSGTPGWTSAWVQLDHTIDLRPSGEPSYYAVPARFFGGGPNLKLKGVRFFWHRQVSPAPATATFNDVPTSHWAFQFVEALAASGITAGCGGGNFCPDDPLTRAQMAVFLSAALGLHWPAY